MNQSELYQRYLFANDAGQKGMLDVATRTYREILPDIIPDTELYHATRYNLSWYEFREENYAAAFWYLIESGRALGIMTLPRMNYPKPRFVQGMSTVGQRILIASDSGAGDDIWSVRCAELLKKAGARSVLWVSKQKLETLLARVRGIDCALTPEEVRDDMYDVWISSLDLPLVLDLAPHSTPRGNYIAPITEYVEKWKKQIPVSKKLKVGIRWQGESGRDASQARSVPFWMLEKLTALPDIEAYSLQRDSGVEDMKTGSRVIDLGTSFETWEDTAAAISLLDLVITSDTSIAHLAPALGVKTWVLCRQFCYYPWISRDDRTSPWYSTARVFREAIAGNWEVPFMRMEAELGSLVRLHLQGRIGSFADSSDGSEQIEAEFPAGKVPFVIHTESELVSEIIRRQSWYSKRDLHVYDMILRRGDLYIDGGANIGWYSLYAAGLVGEEGKILAMEPEQKNYTLLLKNIRLSGAPNLEGRKVALGEKKMSARIYLSEVNFGDHFVKSTDARSPDLGRTSAEVQIVSVDDLVRELGRIPRLVKLDIQGAEPEALLGMRETVSSAHPPYILLEFSPGLIRRSGSSSFDIFAFIEKYQYRPYQVGDDYSSRPLLSAVSIATLLDFVRENQETDVGWDLLLVPPLEQEAFSHHVDQF